MLKHYLASLACIALMQCSAVIAEPSVFKGGHAKYQYLLNTFPDDSLFRNYVDTPATDHNADLRLKFRWQADDLSLVADYQFIAQHGDSISLANKLPASLIFSTPVPDDDHRLFDMTRVISEEDDTYLTHRLDRFYFDVTGQHAVARIGRQAVSWGNGLIYTPMDFFNPFDPATVDKEYKTGDDMLYGQYLQQNGNDLQAVWVIRRDTNGDVSNEVDSIAAKYHGFTSDKTNNLEFDLLLAEHFDDYIIGIGGLGDLGTALWRGDITLTQASNDHAETENVFSLVTSLSYSWVSWGRNISGIAEYFYNGFGQADGDYAPSALAANPELVERIVRGELYTLGRQYLAFSAMIEITPLWLVTPNVFINASDGSFLAQLVSSYDLQQNWQLLAALGIPVGPTGTEYGGIDSGIAGTQLSTSMNIFAQLAWYF